MSRRPASRRSSRSQRGDAAKSRQPTARREPVSTLLRAALSAAAGSLPTVTARLQVFRRARMPIDAAKTSGGLARRRLAATIHQPQSTFGAGQNTVREPPANDSGVPRRLTMARRTYGALRGCQPVCHLPGPSPCVRESAGLSRCSKTGTASLYGSLPPRGRSGPGNRSSQGVRLTNRAG